MSELEHDQTTASDGAWLAMRYVLDELGESERIRFETRLGRDQSLRDRLVEAVLVLQAASAADADRVGGAVRTSHSETRISGPVDRNSRMLGRRSVLMASGLAAIVLAGFGLLLNGVWRPGTIPGEAHMAGNLSMPEVAEIVSRWSDGADFVNDGEVTGEDGDDASWDSVVDSSESMSPPDWLFSAVAEVETAPPAEPDKQPAWPERGES